jgi:hypothetical protein
MSQHAWPCLSLLKHLIIGDYCDCYHHHHSLVIGQGTTHHCTLSLPTGAELCTMFLQQYKKVKLIGTPAQMMRYTSSPGLAKASVLFTSALGCLVSCSQIRTNAYMETLLDKNVCHTSAMTPATKYCV